MDNRYLIHVAVKEPWMTLWVILMTHSMGLAHQASSPKNILCLREGLILCLALKISVPHQRQQHSKVLAKLKPQIQKSQSLKVK